MDTALTWIAGGSGLIGREWLAQWTDREVLALVRRRLRALPPSERRQKRTVNCEAALTVAAAARPSQLDGERERLDQPGRPGEALSRTLTRPNKGLIPKRWRPIHPAAVARAMRFALHQAGPAVTVLESDDMQ